jgi:hypothetical protein
MHGLDARLRPLGPASAKAFMLWIFNTVDTERARRILGSGKEN